MAEQKFAYRTISALERPALRRALHAPLLIVFCAGVNLILIQFVLVRELTALLQGSELVVLLVSAAYFAGLSLGYRFSGRVRPRWLPMLGVATLALHLTLPLWFRLLTGGLHALGASGLAFLILPALTPFVISAFYSLFLPYFADQNGESLARLYAVEVLGSVCGVALLVVAAGLGLQALFGLYSVLLLVILVGVGMRTSAAAGLAVVCAAWLAAAPAVYSWSNSFWFQRFQGMPAETTTLLSAYSAYQKIDVLETSDGQRFLFLDGLEHFGSTSGSWLNVILGRIPASLIRPQNAVVFGAGSMQMELMIANYAGRVTTVEIDPLVIDASLRYLQFWNQMDRLTNRALVVDDAKHFIATTNERFDLAATDLPAAFTAQTAALYSETFYRAVAARLTEQGVFAANLTSSFEPDDLISRRIAAGLLLHFDELLVVTSELAGWSFAYAGDDLPFSAEEVATALQASGDTSFTLYDTAQARAVVGAAQPITLDSLDAALWLSLERVSGRLAWD